MPSKDKPKTRRAQAGDNNPPRDLDVIAGDIRAKERGNVFAIGELLLEAQATCKVEKVKWADWLAREFADWSHDSARNFMAAAPPPPKSALRRHTPLPPLP